jgi:large subunit ribosomal protein L22
MKATLSNYRQAPRKVRLVASSLKGKKVTDATVALQFLPKRAALPLSKLLASAIANALSDSSVRTEDLVVREVRVDKGTNAKRWLPRAFGRASRINKRSSHVTIVLGVSEAKAAKAPKAKKAAPKTKKAAK